MNNKEDRKDKERSAETMTLEERVKLLEEENEGIKKVLKKLIKYARPVDMMYDLTGYR
jgi:hypothetical protein